MVTVTNILTIVFTLLLFVFFIISMYEKVNIELFQQYKGVIFAGSAFMFLGILGLPYMEYDVATQVPSFQIFSTALGILVMLGAIFVYLFNMAFDTYIMWISTILIVTTVFSRISNSAADAEFPPFARDMLILLLVAGGLMGLQKVSHVWTPNNPSIQDILRFVGSITPVALWGMLVYVIYRSIRGLAEYRASKTCSGSQSSIAPFEGYQNSAPSPPAPTPTLNERMQAAIDRLQDSLDLLVDMTDSTCSIIRDVEQGYIASRIAAPDTEMALPTDEQERRRAERKARAEKSFAEMRKVYAGTRGASVLECFQDLDEDIELRELCVQLHGLLDNAETLVQIRKIQSMEVELAFADRLLKKVEGFVDAPSTASTPTPFQLYAGMSGAALRAAATTLLQRELSVRNDIHRIQGTLTKMRDEINKSMQKANMVANGDYDKNSPQNLDANVRLSSITTKIGE